MEWRTALLVLHIAGAGTWLGANVVQALVPTLAARENPATAAGWFRISAKLSSKLYMPAAILILVSGILLVLESDAYGFGSRFVTVGFAMVVVGALFGIRVFAPGGEAAAQAVEAGDPARIRAATSRLAAFGTLDTLLLLLTITVMVLRWE